jgi:hypothetical protein
MSYINSGGSGTVTSVAGTANQISVTSGTTAAVVSLPAAITFPGTISNPLSIFGATTSAQLAGVISDETGSGKLAFATSPALITPDIGVATGTSVAVTGVLTSGSNGGSAGQVALNGSSSSSQTLTTNAAANAATLTGALTVNGALSGGTSIAAGTTLAAATTIATGTNGGTAGSITFNGSTSGSISLTANAGANTVTQSSGTLAVPIITASTRITSPTLTLTAVAPTVSANQVGYGATTSTTVGAAGGASALPITPTGYLIVNVAGTAFKIPYYAS